MPPAIRKDAGLCCGSRLRKGEVFAYVGRNQNLKDHPEIRTATCRWRPLRATFVRCFRTTTPQQVLSPKPKLEAETFHTKRNCSKPLDFLVHDSRRHPGCCSSSSLLLSSLELIDTKVYDLRYEPSSEPLHVSAKELFFNCDSG